VVADPQIRVVGGQRVGRTVRVRDAVVAGAERRTARERRGERQEGEENPSGDYLLAKRHVPGRYIFRT